MTQNKTKQNNGITQIKNVKFLTYRIINSH